MSLESIQQEELQYKVCSTCKQLKSTDSFSKNKSTKDGLQWRCKECAKVHYRENQQARQKYYQKNRDVRLEYCKRYREVHKEQRHEYNRQWRIDNKEHLSRYDRERYENRKYSVQEYSKEWQRTHPERIRQYKLNRKALKAGQVGFLLERYWLTLLQVYGHICMNPQCDKQVTKENMLTLDHIIPLSWGNENTKLHSMDNFQVLCLSCNSRKSNIHATDWRPFIIQDWQQYNVE